MWCLLHLDSWLDYVKVRTHSLLQPSQATALHASHNSFSESTNLWNDLAEAMKASDGKKKQRVFVFEAGSDAPLHCY